MEPIRLRTHITNAHELTLKLPDGFPMGEVEIIIRPVGIAESSIQANQEPLTREVARQKLLRAGLLEVAPLVSGEVQPLSPLERERIGRLLAQGKSVTEILDEEREDRI